MPTNKPEIQKAAYSVEEFCARFGCGRTQLYKELKEGRLERVKNGRRTLIPIESAEAWWQSLRKAG